jgi:hypothetical protein
MSRSVRFESTCVAAATFLPDAGSLQLEYRNGLFYEYFDVPVSVFDSLLAASSKGAFVARFIRGCFAYRRLNATQM